MVRREPDQLDKTPCRTTDARRRYATPATCATRDMLIRSYVFRPPHIVVSECIHDCMKFVTTKYSMTHCNNARPLKVYVDSVNPLFYVVLLHLKWQALPGRSSAVLSNTGVLSACDRVALLQFKTTLLASRMLHTLILNSAGLSLCAETRCRCC